MQIVAKEWILVPCWLLIDIIFTPFASSVILYCFTDSSPDHVKQSVVVRVGLHLAADGLVGERLDEQRDRVEDLWHAPVDEVVLVRVAVPARDDRLLGLRQERGGEDDRDRDGDDHRHRVVDRRPHPEHLARVHVHWTDC